VTAPVPEPPLVVKVSGVATVPLVDVTVNAAWVARTKVTVAGDDDTGAYFASPALVAVTEHVPAAVALNVNGADALTVQPAVPLVAT
jgi:hypothetical protein